MSNAAHYGSASSASGGKHARVSDLLSAADLPEAVSARIDAIVRTSKLWPSEREEIARELIAHAQDALTAGTTPEATAAALGDPATIGQLLRRSVRRKRPLHWQIRYRAYQAIGIVLLTISVVYAAAFVRFYTASPTITRNYVIELNQRNSRYSPEQHAMPAITSLSNAWSSEWRNLESLQSSSNNELGQNETPSVYRAHYWLPFVEPSQQGYESLLEAHERLKTYIDGAINASRRPTLGVLYSDRFEVIEEYGVKTFTILPPTPDPKQSRPTIDMMLPWLRDSRNAARMLGFDAILAASNNDPDRATSALLAIFNIAGLLGKEHTVIGSTTASGIQNLGETVLLHLFNHNPSLFGAEHLVDLAHTISAASSFTYTIDLETDLRFFDDSLQRSFTDDGKGDGRLTPDGMRFLSYIDGLADFEDPDPLSVSARFAGPVNMLAMGTRREQRDAFYKVIAFTKNALQREPSYLTAFAAGGRYATFLEMIDSSQRYQFVSLHVPAITRLIETSHLQRAHTDGTLTAIALHMHKLQTNQWPDSLDELTPRLLPRLPDDPFDPGQPIKYRVIDGTPHLYFIGANGIDNNATRFPNYPNNRSSLMRRFAMGDKSPSTADEDQGDWVVYPYCGNYP